MNVIISILEILLYILGGCFIVSTCILVDSARKTNRELLENAFANPWLLNLDLSFFTSLQEEYMLRKGSHFPAIMNRVSFFLLIVVFILFFILTFIQELMRY